MTEIEKIVRKDEVKELQAKVERKFYKKYGSLSIMELEMVDYVYEVFGKRIKSLRTENITLYERVLNLIQKNADCLKLLKKSFEYIYGADDELIDEIKNFINEAEQFINSEVKK